MDILVGKHKDKSAELVMIKYPEYVQWLLDHRSLTGRLLAVRNHVEKLIANFDSKPFLEKVCSASSCGKAATRFTVYEDNLDPMWWCDSCDPYQFGAYKGKLQSPTEYHSALRHVKFYCNGRIKDRKALVRAIAIAKGLQSPVGESQAQDFFDV